MAGILQQIRVLDGTRVQLEDEREKMVEMAEEISLKLDKMDLVPTMKLQGEELAKQRHRLLSQWKPIRAKLQALLAEIDRVNIHAH